MEIEIDRYDDNDIPYALVVEVEYNCTPLEYEAGYYFGGGVEVESAEIVKIINERDNDGTMATITWKVGDKIELTRSEIESVAEKVISYADDDGGYPRSHHSPDW